MCKLANIAAAVLLALGIAPQLQAQARAEAGLFIDYLEIAETKTGNVGLGGRFGYRIHPHFVLEGEFVYDYGVNFREVYQNVANGSIAAVASSSIGVTEGWVGPMFQPAHGHLRPFVTMKAGFLEFRLSPSLVPYSSVVSTAVGIRTSNLNLALYPGAGAEVALGPLGLRVEVGDAVYGNHGLQNDLRVTCGPVLRF
jgi:hypothetical protein